jgi:hypothetical protein
MAKLTVLEILALLAAALLVADLAHLTLTLLK